MDATVILCDTEKDLSRRLLKALRDASGNSVRVFVKDHKEAGETVAVLLPEHGPSLAAAIRDWASDWWSDVDEERWGAFTDYLRGFGVAVPTDPHQGYATSCPFCDTEDSLSVATGSFSMTGVPLCSDGFGFNDAKHVGTSEELSLCGACQRTFPLSDVML